MVPRGVPIEAIKQVPFEHHKEIHEPVPDNDAYEPDNDFIVSSGLFQRGVALPAFPEWDFHAAALLEVLGLENRPGGRLHPLDTG